MSTLPLLVFVVGTTALVVAGAPTTEGMILVAMLGISAGMLGARSVSRYGEVLFTLMASRTATVAVVCWLWAGAFAGILADSQLVEAVVWIAWKIELTGSAFTVGVFLSAALFAVSVGTGLGTVVGFTAVLFPAGFVVGAHPAALMGAIFSGAAFGDNLAPISDTTIVSAATQETDVGGVVRSRLKYVLLAAGACIILFFAFGAGGSASENSELARELMEAKADPKGLPMLLPGVVVFLIAIRGGHFLGALTAGIVAAVAIGRITGVLTLGDVLRVEDSEVRGSAVDGAMSLVPTAVLTLLLVSSIGLMASGGALEALLGWLEKTFVRTARGAEAVIVALVSLANVCVSVNTVAMITVGPLANQLRKRHGVHPYRTANLLDTVSCSFPYILPYAATMTAAMEIQEAVRRRYEFVPDLGWWDQAAYTYYAIVLFPIMVLAVVTGYGRRAG